MSKDIWIYAYSVRPGCKHPVYERTFPLSAIEAADRFRERSRYRIIFTIDSVLPEAFY